MCCGEEQGHESVMMHGVSQFGAREMCGCEDKHEIHAMLHGLHHFGPHEICSCQGRRFLSKKERKEMLEEYRESLKCELEGVEEELKKLKGD